MKTIMTQRMAALLCCALAAQLASCTFSKFNDYEKKAPAEKIEQEGSRSSGAFGTHVAAMLRQRAAAEPTAGAVMLIGGNGPVALNTVTFSVDGSPSNSEAEADDFRDDLGEPDQITAIAAAPAPTTPVTSYAGPFAYVGTLRQKVGEVRVVDINKYAGPTQLIAPRDGIDNFGIAVRGVNIGGGDVADDLAIGAKGAVVLWRTSAWPNFSKKSAIVADESPRWPASGSFETIAAGELDPSGNDEVAVAARDKNFVAVLHHIAGFGEGGDCEGACVDVTTDANHCGSCGNACQDGEWCDAGQCKTADSCDKPLETCGGVCTNTNTSNNHCGGCGQACDADKGLACKAGKCGCAAGRTACGGVCVDTVASREHCGGCADSGGGGTACGSGELCQLGKCVKTPCPDGTTECDGACVDTNSNADHCGGCGTRCTGNLACQRGSCACVPYQVLEIPLPDNANGFGASLLVANVDNDEGAELVVGAPDSTGGGAVYVYDLKPQHFSGQAPAPDPTVLSGPDGAKSFGAALAVGRFNTKEQLLAVGAPSSDVEGTQTAGRVFLYDSQLRDPKSTLQLGRPVAKGQLGGTLTTVPFKASADTFDVLAASADTAVYVFFANTTADHDDVRRR